VVPAGPFTACRQLANPQGFLAIFLIAEGFVATHLIRQSYWFLPSATAWCGEMALYRPAFFGACMYLKAFLLWAIFLIGAYFYTLREKHPETTQLAAYLIFIMIFSAVAFVIFTGIVLLLVARDQVGLLESALPSLLILLLAFIPAFFVARWQLRKPPSQRSPD
jgi:hypothetical protein